MKTAEGSVHVFYENPVSLSWPGHTHRSRRRQGGATPWPSIPQVHGHGRRPRHLGAVLFGPRAVRLDRKLIGTVHITHERPRGKTHRA